MEELQARIGEALETELGKIYEERGITNGDCSPLQSLQWEKLTSEMARLFAELIEQNK